MNEDNEASIERLIAESKVKVSKNPKGSARGRYNRRKLALAHALEQMQIAIDTLKDQPGTLYKAKEVETLQTAIETFRSETDLKVPEPLSQEDADRIMEAIFNGKPWEPPSKETMAELTDFVERFREEGSIGGDDDYSEADDAGD